MKIIINQFKNKIHFEFYSGDVVVYKSIIDKAEDFLECVDKFLTKYHTTSGDSFKNVKLEFHNAGVLTERIVRATMLGLSFSIAKLAKN